MTSTMPTARGGAPALPVESAGGPVGRALDAGVAARQRMAAAGFDVTAGDGWVLNELSSAVRKGTGAARRNALDFLHGLASDGIKGVALTAGIGQPTPDLSLYKVNLQDWLQDAAFWTEVAGYVSDWAQENYGDAISDYQAAIRENPAPPFKRGIADAYAARGDRQMCPRKSATQIGNGGQRHHGIAQPIRRQHDEPRRISHRCASGGASTATTPDDGGRTSRARRCTAA